MSAHPTSPLLEPRDAAAFARETLARLPAYVPGWRPTATDAGNAVVQVYARYLKSLADRINQAPDKHKLAFLDMLGVFAEFETNLRKERQLEGIAKAKSAGVYKGRPASIDPVQVRQLKADGVGPSKIAKMLGIGRASVYRALQAD